MQNVTHCNHQRHTLHLQQTGVCFVLCFFGTGCFKVRAVLQCCSTKVPSANSCHSHKAPHLPSLYFSSPKTLWANVQMFVWHQTLLHFSNNEQKKKKSLMWTNFRCNVHGLKIWWMYFFKMSIKKDLFFAKVFSTKPFFLFAKISECGRYFFLFCFVEWKDKFSASDAGWKELHARKKTAPSHADLDKYCTIKFL